MRWPPCTHHDACMHRTWCRFTNTDSSCPSSMAAAWKWLSRVADILQTPSSCTGHSLLLIYCIDDPLWIRHRTELYSINAFQYSSSWTLSLSSEFIFTSPHRHCNDASPSSSCCTVRLPPPHCTACRVRHLSTCTGCVDPT